MDNVIRFPTERTKASRDSLDAAFRGIAEALIESVIAEREVAKLAPGRCVAANRTGRQCKLPGTGPTGRCQHHTARTVITVSEDCHCENSPEPGCRADHEDRRWLSDAPAAH